MITKTEQVKQLVQRGDFKAALSMVKTFKIGFTKEEKTLLVRAHEAQWNPAFYEKMGHDLVKLQSDAFSLLKAKYGV